MVRLLRLVLVSAAVAAVVIGLSGRWDDPMLWAYVGVWAGIGLLGAALVPEETMRARLARGPAGADPASPLVFRTLAAAHLAVGALDVGRWHLADTVAQPARLAGLAVFALAFALTLWAVSVNRFFIPAVRLQEERGHHLVTSGPYKWVRHPGYAGMLLGIPASGLALGSWLAVGLALVMAAFVLRRAALEDRFVRATLAGYPDYAARVRYRLVPGVW
jgi:protein-S-isoprenylcysteine O-methyltransferase Ste14